MQEDGLLLVLAHTHLALLQTLSCHSAHITAHHTEQTLHIVI